MWPFRKETSAATIGPVSSADLAEAQALIRQATRRFDVLYPDDVASVIGAGLGVTARREGRLIGIALLGRPLAASTWLRAVALAPGETPLRLLAPLLQGIEQTAQQLSCTLILYGAEEEVDEWMLPALREAGYTYDTEVVVYAKHDSRIPSYGHRAVQLRRAEHADLPALVQLDRRCFSAQWLKDGQVLEQALHDGIVTLAELDGTLVGYSYVSRHYAGRLAHLVRIAVHPAFQHQAIGVRLMAGFVESACASGAEALTLNTQAFNHHAQRLYQWFGFAPTGERQIIMRRILALAVQS